MFPDPTTGELVPGIKKVRYTHDAMIDLIIAEPSIKQNDLAAVFDRSAAWISQIVNSDAFQARLAERKGELVDPTIALTIKERLQAVANVSLEKLLSKIDSPIQLVSDDFLLQSAKFATTALGYGARPQGGDTTVAVQIVQVPPKSASAQEWATTYSPPSSP